MSKTEIRCGGEPRARVTFHCLGLGRRVPVARAGYSFLRYANQDATSSAAIYWRRHHYFIEISFLVTRILAFSLLARWLYKGGPQVEELLFPSDVQENTTQNRDTRRCATRIR